MYNGGAEWSAWSAYLSFFRHVAELDLPVYDKWRHYEDAATHGAGRIMHTRFWIVADRHTTVHVDADRRPHNPDGPARTWGDGWAVWYWHGTRVPAGLIAGEWSTDRILREPNAEVRRCAIERMGWPRFIADAGLRQVGDTAPDPGNPGYELALYDVPEQIYDVPVRVVLVSNATPERDGTRHRFGLTVPADINDPISAASWTFNVTPDEYRKLARAC